MKLDTIKNCQERAKKARYQARALAQLCEVSESAVKSYFWRRWQQSPQNWVNVLRLEEARVRLMQGGHLNKVAADLGFRRTTYLVFKFRKQYGVPPREFVRGLRSLVTNKLIQCGDAGPLGAYSCRAVSFNPRPRWRTL